MNRTIPIALTAAGCLLGTYIGHQLGRDFVATGGAQPAPAPEAATTTAPPAPAPPPDPKALIGDLTDAMRQRDKAKIDTSIAAMAGLDDDALRVAIADAKKLFNRDERRMVMSTLLAELAGRDPDEAIIFVRDNAGRENFNYARPVFLAIIDDSSPAEALALYHQHRLATANQLGISSLFPIFSRYGHEDIDGAIAATATIEGSSNRRQMISSICESSTDPAKREKLLAWAGELTNDKEKAQAYGDLIEIWARRESPEAALAWAEQHITSPAAIAEIEQNISTIHMTEDHRTGAEWLLARATPENRADHLAFAVGRWASHAPNAAGEWLGQQTLDATADKAISHFALAIDREDPESAHAWASRITDPERRESTLKDVMMHWRRLDPKAAAAAATP